MFGHRPERRVGCEAYGLDTSVAEPQRRRMTGVDDGGRSGAQVNAGDLSGHEAAAGGVVSEFGIGPAGLFAESDARPARIAKRPDENRGQERRADLMPHRVGHR